MQNMEVMVMLFQSEYSYQAYAHGGKTGQAKPDTSAQSLELLFGKAVFPLAPSSLNPAEFKESKSREGTQDHCISSCVSF